MLHKLIRLVSKLGTIFSVYQRSWTKTDALQRNTGFVSYTHKVSNKVTKCLQHNASTSEKLLKGTTTDWLTFDSSNVGAYSIS